MCVLGDSNIMEFHVFENITQTPPIAPWAFLISKMVKKRNILIYIQLFLRNQVNRDISVNKNNE